MSGSDVVLRLELALPGLARGAVCMRSRETSFAPSLYRVSTDTLMQIGDIHICNYKFLKIGGTSGKIISMK